MQVSELHLHLSARSGRIHAQPGGVVKHARPHVYLTDYFGVSAQAGKDEQVRWETHQCLTASNGADNEAHVSTAAIEM